VQGAIVETRRQAQDTAHVRETPSMEGMVYATSETAVCSLSDYSSLAPENGWLAVDDMNDEYRQTVRLLVEHSQR
jgi:hypothetical protein